MAKIRLTSPTFDASAQTVTHPSFSDVTLSGIQLIANVTDQVIIYNFADTTKGGTLAGDVLTLEFNTTTMSDTDELMVLVEDGVAYQLPTGAATAANQASILAAVDGIEALLGTIDADTGAILLAVDTLETLVASTNTKLDTVIGHVDGIEATLTAIEGDTSAIQTAVDGIETLIGTTNTTLTTIDGRVDGLEASNSSIQTAVELIDDTVATLGTTTYAETVNKGLVVGAVRRDANTTLVGTTNEIAPLQVNATGELKVAVIQAIPTVTTVATVTNITNQGQIVDDAAATLGTTRAFAVGGIAVAMDGTDPLAVSAEGDAALMRTDPNRIQLVNQTHPRYFRASADYASAQTNTSVVASPGASLSLWITDIIISNGATAGNITLLDGSGGSVVLELYPAINGGLTHSFRNPIKLTAATALCLTSQTVTTHTVTVTGYIAA